MIKYNFKVYQKSIMLRWLRTPDVRYTESMTRLGQSRLRDRCLQMLSTWEDAETIVFGGSVRQCIVSEYTIRHNEELQRRLCDGSYGQLELSQDHFPALGMDLDVYIPRPANVEVCLQSLLLHMSMNLEEYTIKVRACNERYACTRVWVRSNAHPVAPMICVQLDLVFGGQSFVIPDYTSNQLGVTTNAGQLSVFTAPDTESPWWKSSRITEGYLHIPHPDRTSSLLAGSQDMLRRTTDWIKEQIEQKSTHLLLFSYSLWAQARLRSGLRPGRKNYTDYVVPLVTQRLAKLIRAGFEVQGFHPSIGMSQGGTFVCDEGGYSTLLKDVKIGSVTLAEAPMLAPPTPAPRGGKGDNRNRSGVGRGKGIYAVQPVTSDEGNLHDEEMGDVIPWYWCLGCRTWHEVAEFLL
jgi:hypothetical protein